MAQTDVQVARAAYKAAFALADIAYAKAEDAMRKFDLHYLGYVDVPDRINGNERSPYEAEADALSMAAREARAENKLAWKRVDKAKAALQVAMMARAARAKERRRQVRLAEAELAEYEAIMQAVVDEVEQLAKGVANVQG